MFGTSACKTGLNPQATKNFTTRKKPMTRTIRNTLLASGAVLLLSAGAAAAAPATVRTDLNVRSGPGTQYQVVGGVQSGETVDVAGCTGSWCQISFSGGTGYASANYLAMAGGGGPGYAAVAPGYADPGYADPGYVYDDTPGYAYNDYYYDDYGPSFGFSVSPRFRHHRHGWDGRWNGGNRVGGNWQGRPGWNGGDRVGGVGAPAGRMGVGGVGAPAGRMGMGNVGAGFNRGGVGSPQMSAPTGMRMGGGVGAPAGGGGGARMGGGGGAHMGGGGGGGGGGVGGGGGGGVGGPRH
jgi:uncharacterized protein YraI